MADTATAKQDAKPERIFNQVLKTSDPHGTLDKLKARGIDVLKYGSCHPRRTAASVPPPDRIVGCPMYEECPLVRIKGKSGPINLPFRVYKPGGKVREGWGPCFSVIRSMAQYNKDGDSGYVMELLKPGTPVNVPISRETTPGSGTWVDEMDLQTPPPFPKLGDHGYLVHEMQGQRVREERIKQRRAARIDQMTGINPEEFDGEDAQQA